jgi:hypothetical protein
MARRIAVNAVVDREAKTVPTIGLIILIANDQVPRNIDPDEALRYFSWSTFAVIAVVYTAFVFWLELAKDGPCIFSRENARSRVQGFLAHALFLIVLICGYRICTYMVPTIPFWMTDTFRVRHSNRASFIDIVLFFAALAMAYFERKWLYRERTAQENGVPVV